MNLVFKVEAAFIVLELELELWKAGPRPTAVWNNFLQIEFRSILGNGCWVAMSRALMGLERNNIRNTSLNHHVLLLKTAGFCTDFLFFPCFALLTKFL